MPKGPQGHKRPADAIGCAVMFAKLVTGEMTEESKEPSGRVRFGQAGAKTGASQLNKEERSAIAKKAAAGRWG